MTTEAERRMGTETPGWLAAWFFALLFGGMAWMTYWTVTEYEANPAAGMPQHHSNQRKALRPAITVMKYVYPHGGKWGCVAVFAVPSLLLAVIGSWAACRKPRNHSCPPRGRVEGRDTSSGTPGAGSAP
jgi:hypothetical protein